MDFWRLFHKFFAGVGLNVKNLFSPHLIVFFILNIRAALIKLNAEMGLAFDEQDLDLYTNLFANVLQRDPTDVECFDIAQSNSEHSRCVLKKEGGETLYGGNCI